ncbi:hypothetical protein B0O99DRAFT_513301 [Bisporella sp. PMI_857]|nr:hypothetical protein B0O99DRAFT_513301 [Bisporella sp. PMI_857]
MERKRKQQPARSLRGEPPSKKRTPEPLTQPTPPPLEEPLPKSIAPGKPLPTLREAQPENLPANEFQTVSESGVLADSLQRSRAKWISEGIFERYWTKVTAKKKKETPELANNPPKESMTKLGTCTITVEPHIFEASMYAIKDTTSKSNAPPISQQPMYRPIIQYGPPGGMMPPTPPIQSKPVVPLQTNQPATPNNHIPTKHNEKPHEAPSNAMSPQPIEAKAVNGHTAPNNSLPQPPPTNGPPPAPVTKSTDPVIQMLAERAATDPSLKALMRIVANGEASPDELKKFQTHIDELTRLQKARQAASQPATPKTQPVQSSIAGPGANQQLVSNAAPSSAAIAKASPKVSPYQTPPQPQALRSKGPLPPTKPDISGVVFEFTGGSGDRFLFPKFSILEYLPQGQVIASFLIVRKGSSSDSPSYDPTLDYYQPITIRLYAHQGRQLEALQKVVAPQEEVRRYMDDIMDNMTRAEYVLLAMRLPKDAEPEAEKDGEAEKHDQADNQVLWATTNNPTPPPPQVRPGPKVLTEGVQYQNFISAVSEKPVY